MDDVKTRVKRYLQENFVGAGNVMDLADQASFIEIGMVDSTGILELITFIESTYGIQVADGEMVPENLDTLHNIERYVRSKLA